ncbi:MAG: DNA polymerase IV [Gammaproteobacteria bacterium]
MNMSTHDATPDKDHTAPPPHPSLLQRKIIHFDMDCFYAAVEIRDNPQWRGKPLIVGGAPDSRGVVCTASYEARRFGIRSAMPCATAKRLCPEAIFIVPHFEKYHEASQHIRLIFAQFTDQIEPLSLDEAYLDVTQNTQGLYATKIARLLQRDIYRATGLTGSAGVAPNKLVAKIASDFRKPCGLTVVPPHDVTPFMRDLPLRKIAGVGPASEKKLHAMGYVRCQDLWHCERQDLQAQLGKRMGDWLHDRCRGIDTRPVQTQRQRKSIGKEDTFSKDVTDGDTLRDRLSHIATQVATRLTQKKMTGQTITLKVKYSTFQQITRSITLPRPIHDANTIHQTAIQLLERTAVTTQPVRLIGISISKLSSYMLPIDNEQSRSTQSDLFANTPSPKSRDAHTSRP